MSPLNLSNLLGPSQTLGVTGPFSAAQSLLWIPGHDDDNDTTAIFGHLLTPGPLGPAVGTELFDTIPNPHEVGPTIILILQRMLLRLRTLPNITQHGSNKARI